MAMIYLVEDSADLREATAAYLAREGHSVVEFSRADDLPESSPETAPDIYIMDIMLPGTSGIAAASMIRAQKDAPLIFISARDDEMTKAAAFKAGADDYVVKPYSPRELAMRVNAVLRRSSGGVTPETQSPLLECNDGTRRLAVDLPARRVWIDGEEISVTKTEWGILSTICRAGSAVVSREQLFQQVFGYDAGTDSRALDTHMKNLRRKLGPSDWIETVHGQGYRLAAPVVE